MLLQIWYLTAPVTGITRKKYCMIQEGRNTFSLLPQMQCEIVQEVNSCKLDHQNSITVTDEKVLLNNKTA